MIGSGSTTFRPVIHEEVFSHDVGEFYHVIKISCYGLWAVFFVHDGEVVFKYGVGVDQYLIILIAEEFLFLRTVFLAEETRS